MWRMGIVGAGWAGDQHARAIRLLSNRVALQAVVDIERERAASRAREWGASWWGTDYRELLARPDLDAVSLCLPHALHAPVTLAALDAGLHVLVEKPLACTLDEADAMIVAAESTGLTLMVAENVRFHPTYQRVAEIIRGGHLGNLFLLRISREHHMHAYLRARPWFLTDSTAGIMYSGGVHDFEILRMLGGEIKTVYAVPAPKTLPEMTADDTSLAVATLESGVRALLLESFSLLTPRPGVTGTAHGSTGSLWFGDGWIRLYTAPGDGREEAVQEIQVPVTDTFVAELAHFLDCLDGLVAEPLTNAREGRKPLAAVLAAYASMQRGVPVAVDGL
jgi:UDP-N-acetylglucosamine 3-dehydrogenase